MTKFFSKFNQRVILWLLAAFLSTNAYAQLPMTRSTFTGVYTPISVVGGATASTAAGDDGIQASVPIGFSFNYLGTAYTNVAICTNGWISFNATTTSGSFTNTDMYTTTGPQNALFPWFDDLTAGVNSVTAVAPTILYQTQGTPGNQTFTVQWTNFCAYRTAGGSALNFQVVLYEATGEIEFQYGALVQGTVLTGQSASIGIENATGGPGNYLDAMTGSSRCGHFYLAENQWPDVFFRFSPGAPSVMPAGTYTIGAGQNYENLHEAIVDLNQRGISGAVTFNLINTLQDTTVAGGNNFFPILLGPITGTSAANTVTITSASPATIAWGGNVTGSNVGSMMNGTVTAINTGNVEPILGLVGSDFVRINNINIRGNVGYRNADHGIGIYNSTATDGATNNIVENFTVLMNRANTGTRGLIQNVPTAPTAATGANSNNTYRNFTIENVYAGIQLTGNATFPDLATTVNNTVCTNFNTIGNAATANDIGNAGTQTFGIRATNQSGFSISNNAISNVTGSAIATDGILIETFQGTASLFNNKVRAIRNSSTTSTTAIAGIRATHTATGTHTLRIYNNAVSEITSAYTGVASATRTLKGIFLASAGGGLATQSYQVFNNSVSIDGSGSLNLSSACFEIGTTTGPVFTLGNNVFANFTATQTGVARHFAVVSTSATSAGNTGSAYNNNNYFVLNDAGTTGFVGLGAAVNFTTLANWQTAMTQDAASLSVNPGYISNNTDLHATNLALNAAGQALPVYLTQDLDCAARTDNDLGAYNLNGCSGLPTAGSITGLNSVCSNSGTTLALSGASTEAGITYQWGSSLVSGGPYTNMGTSGAQATGALTAQTFYSVTVTCSISGQSAVAAEKVVSIDALPPIAVTPNSVQLCAPVTTTTTLVASGANSYAWSPSTGLSATTGATVVSSATASITYTVVGTGANGCTASVPAALNVAPGLVSMTATATPAALCPGGTSQLLAEGRVAGTVNNYLFSTATGTTLADMTGATQVLASANDDTPMATPSSIGFNFIFNGVSYSQYSVSPDGWILLGGATATNDFSNQVTDPTNIPKIYPYWDDMATGTTGNAQALVTGTAPNRVLVIQWFVTIPRNTTGAANSTFQAWLYEADGRIEFRYGAMGPGTMSASVGLTGNTTTYQSATVATGTSSSSTPVDNNAGQPALGTIYTYQLPLASNYSWSPATFLSATNVANPSASGVSSSITYTATANSSGCTATGDVSISVGSPLSATAAISNTTVCENTAVTLSATPIGGGGPYTYAWSGPNSFSSTSQNPVLTPIVASSGVYTVTITDNCATTTTASSSALTVNAIPVMSVASSGSIFCSPGGTAVVLTASTADTYAWSPATGLSATTGATVNATPTSNVTYTVVGTFTATGCTASTSSVVNSVQQPTIGSIAATPATICVGGTSILTAAGALGGTYCASTHANGCSGDNMANVTLGSINNNTGTTCGGATFQSYFAPTTTTTTTLSVTGGPYSLSVTFGTDANQYFGAWIDYNQNGNFEASEFLGASANAGASGTISVSFTVPAGAYNGVTRLRIVGGNDLAVLATQACGASSSPWGETQDYDVTITGATDPFTYTWSPATFLASTSGASVSTTAISTSTTYTVSASLSGCIATGTVTVTVTTPSASATATAATCLAADGTATATGAAGTAPYTFVWSNGQTTATATGLAAGTYTVTATDANGCVSTAASATVNSNAGTLSSSAAATDATCLSLNGTATATITGGTAPFTTAWSNGGNTTAITGLAAGTYTVTVTDANGCVSTTSATVNANSGTLATTAAATDATCLSLNGTATATITGGTAPFTTAWSNGGNTTAITGLAAGSYTVTVTDANGCVSTTSATVNANSGTLVAAVSPSNAICTASNGVATATNTGGTAPFNYAWSHSVSANTSTVSGLAAGSYSVTITDANGCASAATAVVGTSAGNLSASAAATNATCLAADGTTTATAANGTAPYTFVWNNGQTDAVATGLAAGNYIVTITDANGCVSSTNTAVGSNAGNLSGTTSVTAATCVQANGTATIATTGGTAPFSYLWTTGATDASISGLTAATYRVTVTDANGCVFAANAFVTTNSGGFAATATASNAICTSATGTATATTTGGTAPFSFVWSNAATTAALNNLASAVYTVTATDANGCSSTASASVGSDAGNLSATATGVDATLLGANDGKVNVDVTGGTAPITYLWSNGATVEDIDGLSPGTYTVTITDANGCTSIQSATVLDGPVSVGLVDNSLSVNIFPNPADMQTMVAVTLTANTNVRIRLVNSLGQVIQSAEYIDVQTVNHILNVSELPAAMYMVEIMANGETRTQRLVVTRK